mmetsp:Transcript_128/g.289  ORF Transcript_128/g.289 Transcript_128/m.289 type:complete len:131 (-) Transcript_128:23-415(-)
MATSFCIRFNVPSLLMLCSGGLIHHPFGGLSVGFGARLDTASQHQPVIHKYHLFVAAAVILDDKGYDDCCPQFQSEDVWYVVRFVATRSTVPPWAWRDCDHTMLRLLPIHSFAESIASIPRHPPLLACCA